VPRSRSRNCRSFALLAAIAVTLARPAFAGSPWPVLHFSTGTSFNHTLAAGDLDGDGVLDVATPNSQLSAVTVLLGQGDGTLAPFATYPTFAEPQDVAMADVTGDGILDLVTADYTSGGVTVLPGLGDGTFAPRVAHAVGAGLVALAAVDLDGDRRADLVLSKESGHRLAVLPALPAGGFGAAIEVATGTLPHQIATADFDHDGHPDVAIANFGAGTVSVHRGNGTHVPGAAIAFPCGANPIGLVVADLNRDSDADLLVTHVNAATLSVLLGHGDGTFAAPVAYPTDPRPRGMDAADLDGDGIPDVVIATGYPDGDSALTVYRGRGDGTLERLDSFPLPYRAADCLIADMDGDGHRDIVATGPQAGVVSVLRNPGGTVGAPPAPRAGAAPQLEVMPNPARERVTLRFRAPAGVSLSLEIFDLAGRRIARLAGGPGDGSWRHALWSGTRSDGAPAGPGVYRARLAAGGLVATKRVILLPR
jgi:hypothetical protein